MAEKKGLWGPQSQHSLGGVPSFPEEVPPSSASCQGVAARFPGLSGVDRTEGRGWVGVLEGGGGTWLEFQGPWNTTPPFRAGHLCSDPLLFRAGFLEYLIISLGVDTCHSLKTMDSNESHALSRNCVPGS